ncbi:VOC family protein [Sphingomonas profundi]|uniref:VOC family protein n=1 Tax=Alterirhizorhabdus profundi TaxID=2681549 RepID=UPI0012E84E06|nr:VOC family protein [Sphingomonas profundi]
MANAASHIPNGTYFQACWVVNDLHAAMRYWRETQGVGPFYYLEHPVVHDFSHRGTPTTLDFTAALAQAGPLQIELIAQRDGRGSAYRDSFAEGQEGFHHLGTIADDYDATFDHYRARGYEVAHMGVSGDMRFAYFDTRRDMACMVEIIERKQSMTDFFRMIADAAIDWDGSDPYRCVTL